MLPIVMSVVSMHAYTSFYQLRVGAGFPVFDHFIISQKSVKGMVLRI